MPDSFIPPEDPPTASTPHSTVMYKAPTSQTIAATKPAPIPVSKPTTPSPLQGVAPQQSSIIEPQSLSKLGTPSATTTIPEPATTSDQILTAGSHENATKFNLFISIFIGIVVLIWIGVGLLYYSNTQLEKEVSAPTLSAPTTL